MMDKRRIYCTIICMVMFISFSHSRCLYSKDNVVRVTPLNTTVSGINSVFEIEIQINNVAGLHIIHTELGFDPEYLELVSTEEGGFLGSEGQLTFFYPIVDSTAGTIITDHSILGEYFISGSGIHMKVYFKTLKKGCTNITLSNIQMRDVNNVNIAPVNVENGTVQIGTSAVAEPIEDGSVPPEGIHLNENYPNPFNPSTNISYQLHQDGDVILTVYDIQGRAVKDLVDGFRKKGFHQVRWNGLDAFGNTVPSGMYLFRIQSGTYCLSVKGMLMK